MPLPMTTTVWGASELEVAIMVREWCAERTLLVLVAGVGGEDADGAVFVGGLARVGIEVGQRQLVDDLVVHGDKHLPRLHGVSDEGLGDDRAPLRLDDHALVGFDI